MHLTITDSYLILLLNPEKGRFRSYHYELSYGLAGAILMDLVTDDILEFRENKIHLKNYKMSGVQAYDLLIEKLHKRNKPFSVRRAVEYLGNRAYRFKKKYYRKMEERGIWTVSVKRFLGIIPFRRFRLSHPEMRENLVERLRHILFNKEKADEESYLLIGLLQAVKNRRILVKDKSERKEIKKRMQEILRDEELSGLISESIAEIQAVVSAAVVATTVAATTSSGSG